RYIQWRGELTGPGSEVWNVSVAYLSQNSPPVVRSINVTTQTAASAAAQKSGTNSASNSAFSITVTDTGEVSSAAGTPTQALARGSGSQIQRPWRGDGTRWGPPV